jgi:competence protein ComEA
VRDLPFSRRQIVVAALALLFAAVLASRVFARRPDAVVAPIPTARATTAAAPAFAGIVVDVVGAVRRPGVYRVPRNARVADALQRAGGATAKAELELVNLAALASDGEQIVVPRRGGATAAVAGPAPGGASGVVHLNSATAEQLDSLPGVGPVTAQKILDYRQQHGAFGSLDELDAVPGIGPARLEQLKGLAAP